MYLSQLPNVFVQIQKDRTAIFFLPLSFDKNAKIYMLSHVPSHDLEFYHLLIFTSRYPLKLTLSMGHFSLTFLDYVFSNVSSNFLPEKRHSHIGCICLALLHYAF